MGAGCGNAGPSASSSVGPGGGTAHGAGSHVPSRDSFQGSIRSAAGSYAGYTGRVRIFLHPKGQGLRRTVTVELAGLPCAGASHCLSLSGSLTGALIPAPGHMPDVGRGELVSGAGSVHPLGHVMIRGEVRGTGFIQRGREVLTLTLTSSKGTMTLQATSPSVHGFTSP
jgi:hypothetical protein